MITIYNWSLVSSKWLEIAPSEAKANRTRIYGWIHPSCKPDKDIRTSTITNVSKTDAGLVVTTNSGSHYLLSEAVLDSYLLKYPNAVNDLIAQFNEK